MKIIINVQISAVITLSLLIFSMGFAEGKGEHMHSMDQMKSAKSEKSEQHANHMMTPMIEKELLAGLFENYLKIQIALAGDNLKNAKKEAKKINTTINKDGDDQNQAFQKRLHEIVSGIIKSENIDAARGEFYHLSVLTISLLEHNKFHGKKKALVFHCPMAAGGKGADWLQSSEGTKNPYYGKSMLACGSKVRALN